MCFVPVLCSSTLFFHILCLTFNTKLPALNMFFKPVAGELFRLFFKPFSHSSLDFCITCEMNSFEVFHKCYKQPEIRHYQIWAVRRVWNNLKSDVLFHHCSGSADVGSSIVMLKKHWPPPDEHNWYVVSTSGSSHKSWSQFSSKSWPTFCLFRSCVEVTGLLDHGWLLRSKFPPLSLNFLTHWCTVPMSTVSSP